MHPVLQTTLRHCVPAGGYPQLPAPRPASYLRRVAGANRRRSFLGRDQLNGRFVLMTERYTHLAPHNVRSAVEALDEMILVGPTEP